MKTQASIVARTCRLQEWAQMIQECNNQRPVGMSVSEWCQANSITKANYYYRMAQVRKACLDSIPDGVIPCYHLVWYNFFLQPHHPSLL